MSQTFPTTGTAVDREEWERVLAQLRADGFSPIDSIKITRAVLRVSLGEAKRIVHMSRAWADCRADFDQVHDTVASSLGNL
jgi:ribosomal protein L7/L12